MIVSDYRALLAGGQHRWNGFTKTGRPVVVTYSFPSDAALAPYGDPDFATAPLRLRDGVRTAIREIGEIAGIAFLEIDEGGMIRIFGLHGNNGWSWGETPTISAGAMTDTTLVAINIDYYGSFRPDTAGFYAILHELGHSLGLKDPHEGGVVLEASLDNSDHTVMSYDRLWGYATEPKHLDVDALQHLYGRPSGLDGVSFEWLPGDVLKIAGTARGDVLIGVAGTTRIYGGPGDDRLFGRDSDDVLVGGSGDDLLFGARGEDVLAGNDGDDVIIGLWHSDRLIGGAGNDRLKGGAGHDVLRGGPGNDGLTGGPGRDVFVHAPGDGRDIVQDFTQGDDRIDLTAYGYGSTDEALAHAHAYANGTYLRFGPDNMLVLPGVDLAALTAADLII